MLKTLRDNKKKGFTLVELIVVLVIRPSWRPC